ncbi:uncharacterized protein LOC116308332 isoform X2 [Actinia tenebrosa]|uniref:Uncharacterized protein LOC116308332 isoform X2 n=1 Tax=Actinia tenebrosa TaxID=6105 RepID=A0A6P8J4J1_ACTTE|nr:uncharacterized protein LOC116308332 isoform X2 [Actinia tenebrosa]
MTSKLMQCSRNKLRFVSITNAAEGIQRDPRLVHMGGTPETDSSSKESCQTIASDNGRRQHGSRARKPSYGLGMDDNTTY